MRTTGEADRQFPSGAEGNTADPPPLSRRGFLRQALVTFTTSVPLGCAATRVLEDRAPRSRLSARPRFPSLQPTPGPTRLSLGGSRDGWLYVPESYSPGRAAPLFVALHGAGGAGEDWDGYRRRAEEWGLILLAPDSRSHRSWDLILRGSTAEDVGFLDESLRHVFARCHVDPMRIALGGFSDGATYTLSLGVSNGDLFTHLIAYSPGYILPVGPEVGKPPIFLSHGATDPVLPVDATRNVLLPLLRDAGYDVTYEEFEGGHAVPAEITEKALRWFIG